MATGSPYLWLFIDMSSGLMLCWNRWLVGGLVRTGGSGGGGSEHMWYSVYKYFSPDSLSCHKPVLFWAINYTMSWRFEQQQWKKKNKKNESKNHMSIAVFKYFETSQVIAKFTFAKQLVYCFLLSWILICSAVKDLRTVGKYFITYI